MDFKNLPINGIKKNKNKQKNISINQGKEGICFLFYFFLISIMHNIYGIKYIVIDSESI